MDLIAVQLIHVTPFAITISKVEIMPFSGGVQVEAMKEEMCLKTILLILPVIEVR